MMIRNTKQRRVIEEVLTAADRPISIDEILTAAQVKEKTLGVATVYRNVKTLMEGGRIVAVDLPGDVPRYELSGKGHHHHFHCNSCGRVYETKACIGNLRKLISRRFEITGHELVLYGLCPACRHA